MNKHINTTTRPLIHTNIELSITGLKNILIPVKKDYGKTINWYS